MGKNIFKNIEKYNNGTLSLEDTIVVILSSQIDEKY